MGCIYSKSYCIPAGSPKVHFPEPLVTIINNDNTTYNEHPIINN
jgi:hypothetical protein